MKVIFSPCLYCTTSAELYNLFSLNETLKFIVDYLDAGLDDYDEAFYNDNRLYMPPVMETTAYVQYMSIIENLYKLKTNGENITILSHNKEYVLESEKFTVSNDKEFQIIIDYLYQLNINNNCNDVLLFYGTLNDDYNSLSLKLLIDNNPYTIPIIGNPLLDETGNFNTYIKEATNNTDLFKYKKICIKLAENMKKQIYPGQRNGSLYKKYGRIIALRNKFSVYYPKKPYDKDTIYFISNDRQNIISIDLKHGHFEVFDNTNRQLWVAKYDIYGEEIDRPTDPKILKNIRKNHRVEE